jgi:NTE family protein
MQIGRGSGAMETITGLFLEGLSLAERERLQERLEHRRFPEGSVILGEGDAPREMYIIISGLADVFIVGLTNVEHRISTLGPGDSMGEMSVLTGQPVSATVRAATVVDVLVLPETAFDATFAEFPQLYRNLGSILSARLARTSRRVVQRQRGRANLLVNHGAPPLMGYALASSVAWHTRAPTLHVVWSSEEFDPELRAIAESRPVMDDATALPWTPLDGARDELPRAELMLAPMEGEFAADRLHRTVELLCERYSHVLIEVRGGETRIDIPARTIPLLGPTERIAAAGSGDPGFALRGWVEPPERIGPDPTGVVNVPAPDDSERSSIGDGRLPLGCASGKAIGWAARDLTNHKVGVALGAGAIKGYAHIGVLHALERWGVPIDYMAGTSIGAAVGAMYAAGFPPETCHDKLNKFGAGVFRIAWPRHALLSNSRVRKVVHGVAEERQIEKLVIPLSIVAADVTTGREVVFDRGLLWPAVLASMAIPGIFPPVRIGEYTLVDGGVVNPVPGNTVSGMGADIVLSVKLARRGTEAPLSLDSAAPSGGLPLIIQTLSRSIEIMQGKILTDSAAAATITMEPMFPDLTGWGLRMFGAADSFVEVGEAAAESARHRVSAVLPWLRS